MTNFRDEGSDEGLFTGSWASDRYYPLLFFLDKFKRHSTHPINTILFELSDSVIIGGRLMDLMQALVDGLSSNKGNVKYGAAMICIRIVSIIQKDEDLFY